MIVGKLAEQIAAGAGLTVPTEHAEQVEVVRWARAHADYLPELLNLYAVPNGGERHQATAARLQAEGVSPGVPDLVLAWPAKRFSVDPPSPPQAPPGWYTSLYIEMKRAKGGRVSPAQKQWHARLRAAGCRVEVCEGADAAIGALCAYLGVG